MGWAHCSMGRSLAPLVYGPAQPAVASHCWLGRIAEWVRTRPLLVWFYILPRLYSLSIWAPCVVLSWQSYDNWRVGGVDFRDHHFAIERCHLCTVETLGQVCSLINGRYGGFANHLSSLFTITFIIGAFLIISMFLCIVYKLYIYEWQQAGSSYLTHRPHVNQDFSTAMATILMGFVLEHSTVSSTCLMHDGHKSSPSLLVLLEITFSYIITFLSESYVDTILLAYVSCEAKDSLRARCVARRHFLPFLTMNGPMRNGEKERLHLIYAVSSVSHICTHLSLFGIKSSNVTKWHCRHIYNGITSLPYVHPRSYHPMGWAPFRYGNQVLH